MQTEVGKALAVMAWYRPSYEFVAEVWLDSQPRLSASSYYLHQRLSEVSVIACLNQADKSIPHPSKSLNAEVLVTAYEGLRYIRCMLQP